MAADMRRATVVRLNDHFRSTGEGGWTFLSAGVAALPIAAKDAVIRAVRLFSDFTSENDPQGEHDCAAVFAGDHWVIWKIDHHPADAARAHDPDPADPAAARRVMTIMLAEEY